MDIYSGKKPEKVEGADNSAYQETEGLISKPIVVSGSCACGSTKWESAYSPSRASFCYCKTCRKISGGAFIAFMAFPTSSVTFVPPISSPFSTLKMSAISKNAERGFCSACGSSLTMRYHATLETLYLTIASVDEETMEGGIDALEGLSKKHIYVRDKVDWYKLPDDGIPRFKTMPNEAKYLVFGD